MTAGMNDREEPSGRTQGRIDPRSDHKKKGEEGGGEERGESPATTIFMGRPGCAGGPALVAARQGEGSWEERRWLGLEVLK
jgi:hypothetical protein